MVVAALFVVTLADSDSYDHVTDEQLWGEDGDDDPEELDDRSGIDIDFGSDLMPAEEEYFDSEEDGIDLGFYRTLTPLPPKESEDNLWWNWKGRDKVIRPKDPVWKLKTRHFHQSRPVKKWRPKDPEQADCW